MSLDFSTEEKARKAAARSLKEGAACLAVLPADQAEALERARARARAAGSFAV